VDLFCFVKVFAVDLLKICNFQLVSHIVQKVFDLESLNFTGMLLSMLSCAARVSLVVFFCFVRVIALDLVKICNFQLVSHVAQNEFDLES
jgi:hypothetical protein